MPYPVRQRRRNQLLSTLLLALAAACGLAPARAAEPYGNSLDWVPASSSVYTASLQLKEQVELVADSNAWKKLREIPIVAQYWQQAEAEINSPEGPAAIFWQVMALPENQQMAQVLGEMVSDEIVFYTGESFTKLLELYQVINSTRMAPIAAVLDKGTLDASADDPQAQFRMLVEAIKDDPALVDVPEINFAFRVKDRDATKTQLARMEVIANMFLERSPLAAKFERRKINDHEFLVLYLDGSMIPWSDTLPAITGWETESYDALKDVISKKTLYLAIGQWGDYVHISVNKSTDHLDALGKGTPMAERKELASLDGRRDRALVGVSYVSREMMASQMILPEDLDAFAVAVAAMVRDADAVPESLKGRIGGDLKEFAADFKKYLPTAGAVAGYQFLDGGVYEGFTYSWIEQPTRDGTKPLELVQHVGGSPILAVVARGVDDPDAYDLLAKWIGKAYAYVEEFAVAQLDDEDRDKFKKAMEVARPLLARADEVTREKLVPALADGQSAIVLDADISSKQWQKEMPASFEPLPMAELAILVGVTDEEKLIEAMADYREIINDAIDAVRKENPEEIPEDARLPAPDVSKTSDGTLFAWELNADLGMDAQVAPTAVVNDHVAAIASSRRLAEQVLTEQPLSAPEGALSAGDEPRATVVGFDWPALVTAVEPWVLFAVRQSAGEAEAAADPADDPPQVQEIASQVKSAMAILKCFRGAWSETRRDGDAWVTHSISVFKDLPADPQ